MAELVNLNRARKAKARAGAQAAAAENRIRHGRTKAGKALDKAKASKAVRDLDAGKRER